MGEKAWNPIETAEDFERIFVAGWNRRSGNVAGYWWWHEDTACKGRAVDHPAATHWCQMDLPPFPAAPIDGKVSHD